MQQTIISMSKYQRDRANIKNALQQRLNKLGSITTGEVWEMLRGQYVYSTLAAHFRSIMRELIQEGRVDFIKNGIWFIHKNQKTKAE